MIRAFQRLDMALAGAIDTEIEPVLVLEDIQAGSIKVWLREKIKHVEDQSLYELEWRPMVGKYLLAAKYAFVEWVDDEEERKRPGSLADLRRRFFELASQTDVRKIPTYSPPSAAELIGSADDLGKGLAKLSAHDKARFESAIGAHDFNVEADWEGLSLTDLAVKETLVAPPAPMILAVKQPDYLGESQWAFRHGKKTIRARIEDVEWLKRFQSRQVDVRPGDALRCYVQVTVEYGFDNEVISEHYAITKVDGVLENEFKQSDLFDD